jgi:hypothetical protein
VWRLAGNEIVRNTPLLPGPGVTILDGSDLVDSDAPQQVLVVGNRFRNGLHISWDRSGTGIRFPGNRCRTSDPVGLCG